MEFLVKASAITIIFYCCYKLFLQRETFFNANRWFLIIGLITALCIPFIVIPVYVTETLTSQTNNSYNFITLASAAVMESESALPPTATLSIEQLAWLLYLLITSILFSRFIMQLSSLLVLIYKNDMIQKGAYKYIEVSDTVSPFSFFNYIVYNPKQFNKTELQAIMNHEKVHVDQWHSLDMIFMRLMTIVFWFNPFIWLYKKDLEQNLEFIADHKAQQLAECEKSYQHILLKSSVPNYQLALTNNFYNSLIKKRIVMLHKNRSQKLNQLKIVLVLPLLALFLMSFSTKEMITYVEAETQPDLITETPLKDKEVIIITKNTTDAELDEISAKYNAKGMTLKFKGVKRNKQGEIIKISVSVKTKNSNGNMNESDEDGISPIKITIDGDSISLGDAKHDSGHRDYIFETKDGSQHVKRKSKDGNSVFVHSDGDNHEKHEIIEDKDKIIIKSGDKVHEIKKHKDKNVWVDHDDQDVIEIKKDGDNAVYVIKKDKDGNVSKSLFEGKKGASIFSDDDDDIKIKEDEDGNIFIMKKNDDGNYSKSVSKSKGENIWVEDDDKNVFKIRTVGKGKGTKVFFTDGDATPLIILDGKEVSQEVLDELDSDTIEKMEMIKGDSAIKKYGDKGKDGVLIITTKKKN